MKADEVKKDILQKDPKETILSTARWAARYWKVQNYDDAREFGLGNSPAHENSRSAPLIF
ncbi:MAG: hypothetical protein AB1781_03025 [Pseudomonadota bacterium]